MKTPLPACIKVPKGIVYLGKKGEFKIPASGIVGYHYMEGWSNAKCFKRPRDWLGDGFGYYFADKDSEIAKLNMPKPKKKEKPAPKIPMITITVEGGVVTDVTSKTKVKYKIIDLDNIKMGDSRPMRWETT
jgi:hypothetical protein